MDIIATYLLLQKQLKVISDNELKALSSIIYKEINRREAIAVKDICLTRDEIQMVSEGRHIDTIKAVRVRIIGLSLLSCKMIVDRYAEWILYGNMGYHKSLR